ncbi:MAG: SpoIIE family protein phosphatase [Planctomycetota bacterium]|nr:SpoIIE family protein phosphatase [Planctomycetota bacterium]
MAMLIVLQDGKPVPFKLSQPATVLGRNPQCDVHLPSNMVSREHARVVKEGDAYYFEDAGSGNGSFVRLTGRIPLYNEDTLRVGPFQMKFVAETPAEQNALPPRSTTVAAGQASGTGPPLRQTDLDQDSFDLPSPVSGNNDDENTMGTVEISSGLDDMAQVLDTLSAGTGFGMLSVAPERKLQGILEISRALAGTLDIKRILPTILDTLFNIFPLADRGSIVLKDAVTGKMVPAAQKHRREDKDDTVRLSRTILAQVMDTKSAILSADATADDRFDASESIAFEDIRSMICAPLLNLQGEAMGVINIDTQNPITQFTRDDLELLMAVAGQSALNFESARLLDSFMQKQKQDNEMEIARNVQRALLPETLPEIEGYEFFASYDSAQAVGGDYFDAFMLGEDKVCLSFGDVAGKGVPGALIMARMSSVVESTLAFTHDVEEAMTAINHRMCSHAAEGRFVTYVLVIIDLKTHTMTLSNGGHMSPLIRRIDGNVDEFDDETIGVPIGVIDDYPYDIVQRSIEPGETVVLITDGVDEAMNPAGDLYTKERVREFITNFGPKADELGKALLLDVRKHANGRPQNDDITIMTFGRNA